MGLTNLITSVVLGGGLKGVQDVVEVFKPNAEAGDQRDADLRQVAFDQFTKEFTGENRGRFDKIMDAVNRLPRPAMALSVLGLFVSAMTAPLWFAERMAALALVPDPLWLLLGAIVTFYFGARFQVKGQDLKKAAAVAAVAAQKIGEKQQAEAQKREAEALVEQMMTPKPQPQKAPEIPAGQPEFSDNAALEEWSRTR